MTDSIPKNSSLQTSPIQELKTNINDRVSTLHIKRDDLLHPIISGNKWRKLHYNLLNFEGAGLLSFGGAFSNHLHALAYACHQQSIPLTCIVRGYPSYLNNPTLMDIQKWEADIIFVDRKTYRKRYDQAYLAILKAQYPGYKILPEGGSNENALKGVGLLAHEIMAQFPNLKTIVLPVGSGGTIAGLIRSMPKRVNIIGISVGKESYLEKMIARWLPEGHSTNWQIERNYHYGGFGRCPQVIRQFIKEYYQKHHLSLDPMYNAKGWYAYIDLVRSRKIDPSTSLYLHTGGLQGIRAYQYLYPDKLQWFTD